MALQKRHAVTLVLCMFVLAAVTFLSVGHQFNFNTRTQVSNYLFSTSDPEPEAGNCNAPARLNMKVIADGLHMDTAEGWRQRRLRHLYQYGRQIHFGPDLGDKGIAWNANRGMGNAYFQDNWEPTFGCEYEQRLGHWGDGGKWICNPNFIPKPAVVYSFGSNDEFSFERAIYEYFDGEVEIHTFDQCDAPSKPPYVVYHQHFIGDDQVIVGAGGAGFNTTFKSMQNTLNELNHTRIDVFKIDIEGAEMAVLLPMLRSGTFPTGVKQIQIELHLNPEYRPNSAEIDEFFKILSEKYHMEIFHKEPNIKFGGGKATEFSLVQVNWPKIMSEAGLNC